MCTQGRGRTHHAYVTQLMPSYCEELEWVEDHSEARDDPKGEDDHGIDDDLVRVRVGGRGIAWYARHIVRGPESDN